MRQAAIGSSPRRFVRHGSLRDGRSKKALVPYTKSLGQSIATRSLTVDFDPKIIPFDRHLALDAVGARSSSPVSGPPGHPSPNSLAAELSTRYGHFVSLNSPHLGVRSGHPFTCWSLFESERADTDEEFGAQFDFQRRSGGSYWRVGEGISLKMGFTLELGGPVLEKENGLNIQKTQVAGSLEASSLSHLDRGGPRG